MSKGHPMILIEIKIKTKINKLSIQIFIPINHSYSFIHHYPFVQPGVVHGLPEFVPIIQQFRPHFLALHKVLPICKGIIQSKFGNQ